MTRLRDFVRRMLFAVRVGGAAAVLACLGGIVLFSIRIVRGSPLTFEYAIAIVFMVLVGAGAVAVLAFSATVAGLLSDFERHTEVVRRWAETVRLDSAEKRNEENR